MAKIKLSAKEIKELAKDPATKVELTDPWWVIVLKVIVYAAGLLLAGVGTAEAANLSGLTAILI